ncbi:hypothetical protein [Thiomicrorhabdus sp.]|uniref:hypothetical protein n=1 Tax=Thiomicrorhabdus sp. TaxID=2039724 RepID=UPI002AA624F9|nr:hypothetical protein [Thiomicrorhabdus sp.]
MTVEAIAWLMIITPSIITGIILAYFVKGRLGLILSALVPWIGLLIALLCEHYFFACRVDGIVMWPIAQLFGGTIAAIAGIVGYQVAKDVFCKKQA